MEQSIVDDLYRRWHKPVRTWIRKRCDVPQIWVEDLTQEVFLRLLRYQPAESVGNIAGYIFVIASNVANEWMDRSCFVKTHVDYENLGEGVIGISDPPEISIENRELQVAIELGMSKLESRKLLILMLRVYEEKTYKEIAVELGLTYRTVLRDLTRAYQQLRVDLRDLVETSELEEIDNELDSDRPDRSTEAGGQLSGMRPASTHVGASSGIRDGGPATEQFPICGDGERLSRCG